MMGDCFLRPVRKHPTSSSYITGAPLTSANIILVVVLSVNPIRRRLDTGSRGVMFYVDSSNILRTNHLSFTTECERVRLKRLIVLQVGKFSFFGRNDCRPKCGTFEKLRTRYELPRRKKREKGCIIGYLLVTFGDQSAIIVSCGFR